MLEHRPVLLREVPAALNLKRDGWYLDATFGRGGHTAEILSHLEKEGRVLALDRDPDAVRAGAQTFAGEERLFLERAAFSEMAAAARRAGFVREGRQGFDGVLFDLGVSSPQLDDADRGFSFMKEGPLDMRMNNSSGPTAAAWLAKAGESEIARVIRDYGEERHARRIAQAIVQARGREPIERTLQLANIVADAVPGREPGKHPATRTFQAIRIQVNDELGEIHAALDAALGLLAPAGRLCVISFHSLEDGIVKRFMQKHSQDDPVYAGLPEVPPQARARLARVGRTVHPSPAEIEANPRARSALMRVAAKVAQVAV